MKIQISDKQRSMGVTVIWVFSICLLIGIAVWRFSSLMEILKKVIAVLAPILYGIVIAYLLSPLMVWLENKFGKPIEKKKPHPKAKRACAVTGSVLIMLAAITGIVAMIMPEFYSSLKSLMTSLPDYMTSATKWVTKSIGSLEESQPQVYGFLNNTWATTQDKLSHLASEFEPKLENLSGGADILSTITSGAFSVVNAMKNFVLGIMVAIYLLFNKETYQAQVRKLLYALLPENRVHRLLKMGSHVSHNFMHFLIGKTLDSMIIGLLCFIGMSILRMPYIALISLLVGVTNIIPFFGPFLGAIPSGLLILFSNPSKAIPFAIFILILQQFDGNFLGPKILGDSLGLPMVWVMFAIFVGGGIFGFAGMVAFVPLFAALYTFVSDTLSDRLTNKGLPCDTACYMTGEPIFAKTTEDANEEQPTEENADAEPPKASEEEKERNLDENNS